MPIDIPDNTPAWFQLDDTTISCSQLSRTDMNAEKVLSPKMLKLTRTITHSV